MSTVSIWRLHSWAKKCLCCELNCSFWHLFCWPGRHCLASKLKCWLASDLLRKEGGGYEWEDGWHLVRQGLFLGTEKEMCLQVYTWVLTPLFSCRLPTSGLRTAGSLKTPTMVSPGPCYSSKENRRHDALWLHDALCTERRVFAPLSAIL